MTQNASCIFHNCDDGDDDYNESVDVDDRGGDGDGDDDDDVESERSQDAQRVGWAVSAPTNHRFNFLESESEKYEQWPRNRWMTVMMINRIREICKRLSN